jgi:hypothetical protein
LSRFTHAEKSAEAAREVQMRLQVWGPREQMPPFRQRRLDIMREIADEYAELAKKDQLL